MNQPCVFSGVAIDGVEPIKNTVRLGHFLPAFGASAVLRLPLHILQSAPQHPFAALIIDEFLGNLSIIGKAQFPVATA
jgi:hypothetical protein